MTSTPLIPDWDFSDRLRKIRREVRMGQAAFADRIGVGQDQLAHWEAGRHRPRDIVAVAQAVEREFGYSAAWLLDLRGGALAARDETGLEAVTHKLQRLTRAELGLAA